MLLPLLSVQWTVLAGLPPEIALVNIDNILVSGQAFQKQLDNLKQVFQCLRNARLKLSPKKCYLFQKQVNYLGHIISQNEVRTKSVLITVWESPQPRCITEVRHFLGLCSYYRRFILQFAHIAAPLHWLLESRQPLEWPPEACICFPTTEACHCGVSSVGLSPTWRETYSGCWW